MSERFEHNPQEFVDVLDPTLIYVGIKNRVAFDKISAPCTDHGEKESSHVLSKSIEGDGVMVVFQYWIKSLTLAAVREDLDRKRAKAGDAR